VRKGRWLLALSVIHGIAFVIPPLACAQESQAPVITLDAFGLIDRVAIYDGDATVGGYSNWGFTGSLSLRSAFPIGGELFIAYTPKDTDPYSLTPQILLPGGWITLSLGKDPRRGLDVFLAAGAAYLDVSGWPDFSDCIPPECFKEGGPTIQNGGDWSFVWGGGVDYRFPGRIRLRLDARIPSETDAIQERTTRIGIGAGLRIW